MPRNRDVCTAYLSYLLRTCDVCVAYPRLSFRIYGVSATYVWRISRINGVCATYVSLLRSMCDVLRVLGIFCGIPREYQMFLTGRGGEQGSFRVTLGVASVFIHDILRPGWGAWRCPPLRYRTCIGQNNILKGYVKDVNYYARFHIRSYLRCTENQTLT